MIKKFETNLSKFNRSTQTFKADEQDNVSTNEVYITVVFILPEYTNTQKTILLLLYIEERQKKVTLKHILLKIKRNLFFNVAPKLKNTTKIVLIFPKTRVNDNSNGMHNVFLLLTQAA